MVLWKTWLAAGTESGDWSCTPVTDYFSYANRLWEVGSGDVQLVFYLFGSDVLVVVTILI